jgi:hypothetical protein
MLRSNYFFGIGGVLLGLGIGLGISNSVSIRIDSSNLNPQVLEQKINSYNEIPVGKTQIFFQRLEKTGENQYKGRINGKIYTCNFDLDDNRVEFNVGIRR